MEPSPAKKLRPRPAFLRALGRSEPPQTLEAGGVRCELLEIFKHDSWAATALYGGVRGKITVKFNRRQPFLFVPMGWLGRWLGRREARAYQLLAGLPGIPASSGEVRVDGRWWPSAFAHEYLEGHPLHCDEKPGDEFFKQLGEMIGEMHRRGLAYVDLNKRENIIVTDGGTPVLVDFQIHFAPPRRLAWLPPFNWLLRGFMNGDLYHLRKHVLRHRPDLVPPGEHDLSRFQPLPVRIWRMIYVAPVQFLRRRFLVWLRVRDGKGLALSEIAPEKAVRLTLEKDQKNIPKL
jgi:hypothetical protein